MQAKPFPLCRFVTALLLLFLAPGILAAAELTQDDIDFRKQAFVNKKGDRLLYRLFVPLGYNKERKYPLLLWLHGGDGRGSDNIRQLKNQNQLASHFWISKDVQNSFPVFVMLPQCPMGENWAEPEFNQPGKALQLTMEALNKVQAEFPIDPDRVYIGGQAMGALGVWAALQKYSGQWAAALIMSAYDNFSEIDAIVHVPLWVFQGDMDDSVPITMVRDSMKQLKKANANLRYTEYHKQDHEVWKRAYAEPDLVSWLSAQRRPAPPGGQVGSGTAPQNR